MQGQFRPGNEATTIVAHLSPSGIPEIDNLADEFLVQLRAETSPLGAAARLLLDTLPGRPQLLPTDSPRHVLFSYSEVTYGEAALAVKVRLFDGPPDKLLRDHLSDETCKLWTRCDGIVGVSVSGGNSFLNDVVLGLHDLSNAELNTVPEVIERLRQRRRTRTST